jgi:Mg2+ and Co2+ transporter CorA
MIAQDWDLVLSQMGQTLDDIDRKISDNTELRKNVLPWRRLLGSWRMTIIEYKAKLFETDQFLRSQMPHKGSAFRGILSSGETSQRQSPDGTYQQSIPRSIESELEDIIFSYEILAAGIKEIETRVDRSFQALMSSMSILESQKAITQGSAVARLTELAFIFITLNFACTFFSMQIKV